MADACIALSLCMCVRMQQVSMYLYRKEVGGGVLTMEELCVCVGGWVIVPCPRQDIAQLHSAFSYTLDVAVRATT